MQLLSKVISSNLLCDFVFHIPINSQIQMLTTKISALKHGTSNVQIEGVVKQKSDLKDGPSAKYFSFYLHDAESHSIRIAAFKDLAVQLFDKIENGRSYRISKVSVSNNNFRGVVSLQIIWNAAAEIVQIDDISTPAIKFTPMSDLKKLKKGTSVNIIGRIVDHVEKDVTLTQGSASVLIVTLMEKSYRVDATFWDHKEIIQAISADEISLTIVLIENAIVNIYNDSVTLNVNKSSIVKLNPENEASSLLRNISDDGPYVNLSQQSQSSTSQTEFSNTQIATAIKRDLSDIEDELKVMDERKERLKIRKMLLTNELSKYV